MPDTALPHRLPVRVPLVNDVWGIWKSLSEARSNVLRIIPEIATSTPMVSGKTGKRWHMVMDPDAIRHMLLDKLDIYPKSVVTKNLLKPAIGESLFTRIIHRRWFFGWRTWHKRLNSCMNLLLYSFTTTPTEFPARHARRYPDPARSVTGR